MATVPACSAPPGCGPEVPIAAGAFWFGVVFAIGSMLGALRVLFFEGWFGPASVIAAEAVPLLLAMVALGPAVADLFDVPADARDRLLMGGTGLFLTLLVDGILVALLRDRDLGFWIERLILPGRVVYAGLLAAVMLLPLLRWPGRRG